MKSNKGGKREGSGRKPGLSQISKTYRIDNDLAEWMGSHVGNKNFYINAIIRNDIENRKIAIDKIDELLKNLHSLE